MRQSHVENRNIRYIRINLTINCLRRLPRVSSSFEMISTYSNTLELLTLVSSLPGAVLFEVPPRETWGRPKVSGQKTNICRQCLSAWSQMKAVEIITPMEPWLNGSHFTRQYWFKMLWLYFKEYETEWGKSLSLFLLVDLLHFNRKTSPESVEHASRDFLHTIQAYKRDRRQWASLKPLLCTGNLITVLYRTFTYLSEGVFTCNGSVFHLDPFSWHMAMHLLKPTNLS